MEMNQTVLDAATTNVASDLIDGDRMPNTYLQLTVEASATLLTAAVDINCSLEPSIGFVDYAGLTAISPLPTGITLNAATGVITISSPNTGRSDLLLRCAAPPKYMQAGYVYTSGGGTVRIRLKAYGWKQT